MGNLYPFCTIILILFLYRCILVINIYRSQKLDWKCFVHFSVKEILYNIFLSLIFDSVFRSVIPSPHSGFHVLELPSSPWNWVLEYTAKFYFGEAATMSLLQKKSGKNVLYRYMLSKKRQHTRVRTVGSKMLSHETCKAYVKLTCETIFTIDIDEMFPKLLNILKYASMYLNNIKNVLRKQQGSTV